MWTTRGGVNQSAGFVAGNNTACPNGDGNEELSEVQMVSVFIPSTTVGNVSLILSFCSLLDTGSPVSFIRKTSVHEGMSIDHLMPSPFKGLGSTRIPTYGRRVALEITFQKVN